MVCYFIPALKAMLDAATQAYGYSVFTTATSILSILGLRIVWMSWIYPLYPYYESIIQCYVISWLLSLIMNAVIFFVIHKKMLRIMADAEQKMLQKVN